MPIPYLSLPMPQRKSLSFDKPCQLATYLMLFLLLSSLPHRLALHIPSVFPPLVILIFVYLCLFLNNI